MIVQKFEARVKRIDSRDVDISVAVTFSYDAGTDPFAVQAVFCIAPGEVRVWRFSRELLEIGSRASSVYGAGDVKFRRFSSIGAVLMCLRGDGDDGGGPAHADIALPAAEVEEFLNATREAAKVTPEECVALVDVFLKELFQA